jgi:hypothetical protein
MSELSTTVGSGFAEYFDNIREKLHKWVDPLSSRSWSITMANRDAGPECWCREPCESRRLSRRGW